MRFCRIILALLFIFIAAASNGASKRISFSGYEWEALDAERESGGVLHRKDPANVWTDRKGWLHLRLSAEIRLTRSLGYGSYLFVVHRMPRRLDPAAVLGMFTWDASDSDRHHREIDIEISQWGDNGESRNAQFVIQPYEVPENLFRFRSPAEVAAVRHGFEWRPGRVSFRSSVEKPRPRPVAQRTFTTGIPAPGDERVHINFFLFGKARNRHGDDAEIVLEKFTFTP